MEYSIRKQVDLTFAETLSRAKESLAKEGFGVLTEIDVKATLKKKLGADWMDYTIVGACNPPFAFEALKAEREIGLFLPCNIIVYEDAGKIFVAAVKPTIVMGTVGSRQLAVIAEKVEEKLRKAVQGI